MLDVVDVEVARVAFPLDGGHDTAEEGHVPTSRRLELHVRQLLKISLKQFICIITTREAANMNIGVFYQDLLPCKMLNF